MLFFWHFYVVDPIAVNLEVLEKERGVPSRIIYNINIYPYARVK